MKTKSKIKYKNNNKIKQQIKTNNILPEANNKNITKIHPENLKINHIPLTKVNSDSLLYKHQENKEYIYHQETQYITLMNSQKQIKQYMVPQQYNSINQIQMKLQIVACQDPKAPITITINNANTTTLPIKLQPRYLTMRNIPNYEIQYQTITSTITIIQINIKYTIKHNIEELDQTLEIEPQNPGNMCDKSFNNNLTQEKHQHLVFNESELEQQELEEEEDEESMEDDNSITSLIHNQQKLQPILADSNNNTQQRPEQLDKISTNTIIVLKDNIIKRKPKLGDTIIAQQQNNIVQVIVDYNPKIKLQLPERYYIIKDLQAINLIQQQLLKVTTKHSTVINEYQAILQIQ